MEDTTIGQRIARERKRLNLSQEAFGEKMGVSRQAISKWEADGAVPEIDKLIAMSKLFGVSIGWLLGVEEAPEPREEETFSDKQLELLEQILQRYRQPEPATPSRIPRILAAVGIGVALIIGITALRRVEKLPDYSGQLNSISGKYSNLQGQLSGLAGQLEEMAQGERLLAQYEFAGEALEDLSGVCLKLTATPKIWQPGDKAELSVRKDGTEVQRIPCDFAGSAATAQWELPGDEGYYTYCFIRYHQDGSQEQEILDNVWYYAQEPWAGLRPDWNGYMETRWDGVQQKLVVDRIDVHYAPPGLLQLQTGSKWASVRLLFLLDGQTVKEMDLLEAMGRPDIMDASEIGWLDGGFWPDGLIFTVPEDSLLEAVILADYNGKYTFRETVSAWEYRDGILQETLSAD